MASDSPATLYVGINRTVLALDATTGMARWRTELPGTPLFGGFVTIHVNGDHLYAAAAGELSCLDRATGAMVWHNGLEGYGLGFVTLATESGSSSGSSANDASAAAAATAAATAAAAMGGAAAATL